MSLAARQSSVSLNCWKASSTTQRRARRKRLYARLLVSEAFPLYASNHEQSVRGTSLGCSTYSSVGSSCDGGGPLFQ